jgi:hypothetical protein
MWVDSKSSSSLISKPQHVAKICDANLVPGENFLPFFQSVIFSPEYGGCMFL